MKIKKERKTRLYLILFYRFKYRIQGHLKYLNELYKTLVVKKTKKPMKILLKMKTIELIIKLN